MKKRMGRPPKFKKTLENRISIRISKEQAKIIKTFPNFSDEFRRFFDAFISKEVGKCK